jgi:hypothetical protein
MAQSSWRCGRSATRWWQKLGTAAQTHRSTTERAVSGGDVGQNSGEMAGESRGSRRGGLPAEWLPDGGYR